MLVELEPFKDERGSFSRVFCDDEFARAGIAIPASNSTAHANHERDAIYPPKALPLNAEAVGR